MICFRVLVPIVLLSACSSGLASDDSFLIPTELLDSPPETPPSDEPEARRSEWTLDARLQTQGERRYGEYSGPDVYLSLNTAGKTKAAGGTVVLSSRLSALAAQGESFSAADDSALDIRELYFSKFATSALFVDFGRFNHRSGVATGFNPTDYYKAYVGIDTTDTDARSRRNNRLGTLGLRFEKLLPGGSFNLILSPEISADEGTLAGDKDFSGLNVDRSNAKDRALLSFAKSSARGRYMRFSLLAAGASSAIGLAKSMVLTDKLLSFAELSVAQGRTRFSDSVQEEPELAERFVSSEERVRLQSSLGFSYTSSLDIETTFEYHYSGFAATRQEESAWFALLESEPQLAGELWSIRQHYSELEEPFIRHTLWLRSVWNEPVENVSIGVIGSLNPDDASGMTQLSVNYNAANRLSLAGRLTAFHGSSESFFGTVPGDLQYLFQMNWRF